MRMATGIFITALTLEIHHMLDVTGFIRVIALAGIITFPVATLAYTHAVSLTVEELHRPSISDCMMKDSQVRPKLLY